jgi:hypothetical protein
MPRVSTPGAGLAAQHDCAALHRVRGQLGAAGDQLGQLSEQPRDDGGLRCRTGDGDLVAAHVDIGVGDALDHVQQLVTRPEQAHHRLVVRYHDLDLGAAVGRLAPARIAWIVCQ